jgi:hypothetical protein
MKQFMKEAIKNKEFLTLFVSISQRIKEGLKYHLSIPIEILLHN